MMVSGDDTNERVCEEARHTLNEQMKRLERADSYSLVLFRLNLVLAGVVLTAAAFVDDSALVRLDEIVAMWAIPGLFFLFISTIAAICTYSTSTYQMGISPAFIKKTDNGEYSDKEEIDERLTELYADWLEHNANAHKFNTYVVTVSLLAMFDATVLFFWAGVFTLIGYDGLIGTLILLISIVFLLILLNYSLYKSEWLFNQVYGNE